MKNFTSSLINDYASMRDEFMNTPPGSLVDTLDYQIFLADEVPRTGYTRVCCFTYALVMAEIKSRLEKKVVGCRD